MRRDQVALSKRMSHALRHAPEEYGLVLDPAGWTTVASLIGARQFTGVTEADVVHVVEHGSKRRFEVDGGRIRAVYGHSVTGRVEVAAAVPPGTLFHGTTMVAWQRIRTEGLRPSGRQYVHLSADRQTAETVAVRRRGPWVLLRVHAAEAAAAGVMFYRADEGLWLADVVPADHIEEDRTF